MPVISMFYGVVVLMYSSTTGNITNRTFTFSMAMRKQSSQYLKVISWKDHCGVLNSN